MLDQLKDSDPDAYASVMAQLTLGTLHAGLLAPRYDTKNNLQGLVGVRLANQDSQ